MEGVWENRKAEVGGEGGAREEEEAGMRRWLERRGEGGSVYERGEGRGGNGRRGG